MSQKYTHAIPIEHNLKPGALWKYKHTVEELEVLERTNPHVYSGQYQQSPSPKGGGIYKTEWWQYYEVLPNFDYRIITADTAQKDKENNDFTVLQLWGAAGNRAYLIDQYRDKIEAYELELQVLSFWNKNVNIHSGVLRAMFMEDKSSGSSIVQRIRREGKFPIIPIQRNISKVVRFYNATPSIASGLVYLPKNADFLHDYKEEHRKITALMTHSHDDQADSTCDAIDLICLGVEYDTTEDADEEIKNRQQHSDLDYSANTNMANYMNGEEGLF